MQRGGRTFSRACPGARRARVSCGAGPEPSLSTRASSALFPESLPWISACPLSMAPPSRCGFPSLSLAIVPSSSSSSRPRLSNLDMPSLAALYSASSCDLLPELVPEQPDEPLDRGEGPLELRQVVRVAVHDQPEGRVGPRVSRTSPRRCARRAPRTHRTSSGTLPRAQGPAPSPAA